jgi:peroxiredoxin
MFHNILKYWNIGVVIILFLGIGWIRVSSVTGDTSVEPQITVPKQGFLAPDFTLEMINGEMVTLSDLHGRVILVNFWASWCPPCRAEMPAMQIVYNDYKDQGLSILAVNSTIQDQQSNALDFVNENGLTFPVLFDFDGGVTAAYHIDALPTSFFIGRDGIIQDVVIGGPMPEALLREQIENLLKQ